MPIAWEKLLGYPNSMAGQRYTDRLTSCSVLQMLSWSEGMNNDPLHYIFEHKLRYMCELMSGLSAAAALYS